MNSGIVCGNEVLRKKQKVMSFLRERVVTPPRQEFLVKPMVASFDPWTVRLAA